MRGTTLMMKLFAFADISNLTVGFYGGQQRVLDEISARLMKDYPKLKISYSFFTAFQTFNKCGRRGNYGEYKKIQTLTFLFVGLGCPKQERWMAQHKK